ncbi:MAG TPA: hypothetical protein VNA19_05930 [Pyrinomonadaceae bacterium]|jgi:hypothetical protein|nr:hypothetical protein [Pyrinomonadaceae bacterium]
MNTHTHRRRIRRATPFVSLLLLVVLHASPAICAATQRAHREHLTPEEVELVRDNQELDKRMGIFVKAIERRLAAISNPQLVEAKPKDAEKWGVLPQSTRAQFLADISGILSEATTNVEDASLHDEKSPLIPKAVRILAAACNRFLPQLTPLRETATTDAERESIEKTIENAQEIIEATGKLAPETKPEEKKSKSKS